MFKDISCVLEVVSCSCFDYIIDHYLLQLGDSFDKVYQVGIAKFSNLKPCRTNYGRFDAANLELLKPVQCVNVAPAYIVRRGSIPLCCRGSVQTGKVSDQVEARNAAERHANKSLCRLRAEKP